MRYIEVKMKVLNWILIVIVLIGLGVGGYLYVHSKEPMIKKEGGMDIYTKGFTYESENWERKHLSTLSPPCKIS